MFYGWYIIIFAFVLAAWGGATIWHGFTAFFDPLIEEFAWSYTAISLAASFRGAEAGLMDVAVGFLVDRFGISRIILFGAIMVGIGWLILSHVNSLGIFYLSFFIISIGAGGISGVVFSVLIMRWFNKRIGLALGLYMSGFAIGGLALPGIVYLLDAVGFRFAFQLFGFTTLLIGGITAYLVRDWPRDIGTIRDGADIRAESHMLHKIKEISVGNDALSPDYTTKKALSKAAFWIITYASLTTVFAIMMITTHIVPYLEHIGYSRHTASLVAMTLPITSVIGRLGIGWISDKIGHKTVLILMLSGQLISMVLFLYSNVVLLLILFIIIFGLSWGGMAVVRPLALRNYFGTTNIGSILGSCFGITMIGSMIGPLLAGWIFDMNASYSLAWIIAGFSILTSIPLVTMMKHTK